MITDELKTIVRQLNENGKMSFTEGASEEQISQSEKKNGISLPEKYREWLKFSDGGECYLPAGVQFYGVAHKPIIDAEDNDRPDNNYIVIGTMASGDPVLCERSGEKISVYEDFFAFLKDLYDLLGIGE